MFSEINKLKIQRDEFKSSDAKVRDLNLKFEDLQVTSREDKKKLEEYEEKSEQSALTLQRYIENYNSEIALLKSELNQVRPKLDETTADLQEKLTEINQKNEEIDQLNNSLTEIGESLEKTQETLFQKLAEFEELKKTTEEDKSVNPTTDDAKINDLQKIVDDQNHCISQYKAQTEELQDRNDKLLNEIKELIPLFEPNK